MSATPPDVSRRAPLLGEHTEEVLTEAGYNGRKIAALRQSGAVR
jgi:crotonobetainyl-CoA:carnitine CoA-transferase CaiB-like acyl-CoA transferase